MQLNMPNTMEVKIPTQRMVDMQLMHSTINNTTQQRKQHNSKLLQELPALAPAPLPHLLPVKLLLLHLVVDHLVLVATTP